MKGYILPGVLGLLMGLILHWTRLCHPGALRDALALRRSHALRSLMYFLGTGMAMTALLCWLAVIDVDRIVPLPLSAGALLGGALFGAAAALAGYTPLTAFAGVGGQAPLHALCALTGCFAGTLLLPLLRAPLSALQSAPPYTAATLFAVTLDEPWLLGGGFLAQGCAGLLLAVIAACIPSNKGAALPVEMPEPAASAPDTDATEAAPADIPPAILPEPPVLLLLPAPEEPEPSPPEAAPGETFVALLPGEEPLVVDTTLDDAPDNVAPSAQDGPPDHPSEPSDPP